MTNERSSSANRRFAFLFKFRKKLPFTWLFKPFEWVVNNGATNKLTNESKILLSEELRVLLISVADDMLCLNLKEISR